MFTFYFLFIINYYFYIYFNSAAGDECYSILVIIFYLVYSFWEKTNILNNMFD